MANNYNVVFSGSLKDGVNAELFVRRFMRTFKVPEDTARKLVTIGHDVTMKSGLDPAAAERYRSALDLLGMQVRVECEEQAHAEPDDSGDADFADAEPVVASEPASFKDKLIMGLARGLRHIFPPLNEYTVFVIAVTLYTTFLYVDGFPSPFDFIAISFTTLLDTPADSVSAFIEKLLTVPVTMLLVLTVVVGPLMLPFTKRDMRWTCALVIAIFALLTAVLSIRTLLNDGDSLLNTLIVIYSLSWLAYMLFVLRFVKESGFIMTDEQSEASSASVAAILSVLFVYVAYRHYSVEWLNAFVVGVTSSASIVPLLGGKWLSAIAGRKRS